MGRYQTKLAKFFVATRDAGFHEYFKRDTGLDKTNTIVKQNRIDDELRMSFIRLGTGLYTFFAICGVFVSVCWIVFVAEVLELVGL